MVIKLAAQRRSSHDSHFLCPILIRFVQGCLDCLITLVILDCVTFCLKITGRANGHDDRSLSLSSPFILFSFAFLLLPLLSKTSFTTKRFLHLSNLRLSPNHIFLAHLFFNILAQQHARLLLFCVTHNLH